MAYELKYNNRVYPMENKTIEIAQKIKDFTKYQSIMEHDDRNIEDIINEQYRFACTVLGQDVIDELLGDDLQKIDIDLLLDICFEILEAYQSKALKKRREREAKEIENMMNNKAVKQTLEVAKQMSAFHPPVK